MEDLTTRCISLCLDPEKVPSVSRGAKRSREKVDDFNGTVAIHYIVEIAKAQMALVLVSLAMGNPPHCESN